MSNFFDRFVFLLCFFSIFLFVPILSENSEFSGSCGVFSNISGLSHRNSKVIGGKNAYIQEFPWHASLQKFRLLLPTPIPDWRHTCGASILNEYWLLTAAHCVDGLINSVFPGQLRVVIGTDRWRFTLLQSNIQMLNVAKIVTHPNWNSRTGFNDIALIKTSKLISFNDRAKPICLPGYEDYSAKAGDFVTIAGYGYTTDRLLLNVLPDRLQTVQVPVIRMDVCRKQYNRTRITITDNMICAGITSYGVCSGAMRGDSGSAMVTYENDRAIHTGVVSFSLPCRMTGAPDVYTRTAPYLKWIQAVMKNN